MIMSNDILNKMIKECKTSSDLRRLQIAYFGGRFNNQYENEEQNLLQGSSAAFEKFTNLYLNKQM